MRFCGTCRPCPKPRSGLKAAHPNVEWKRISAFRNVLVHNYLGIDLETVWRVVQEQVPELKAEVEKMLDELPGS
jgi:uncharacterized protein with HEPN domain